MGNRADRRASAKIAKQAVKRAKSPTEAGILRAAAAFAGEGQVGLLGPALAAADFDEAWTRLSDDLHDILEELYPDFLVEAYIEAGTGLLHVEAAGGAVSERGTRFLLCPVAGMPGRMGAFARDPAETARLAASFEQSGVTLEGGRCAVFPILLPLAAFDPKTTTPARVRRLHDALSDRLAASWSGETLADEADGRLLEALGLPGFDDTSAGPTAAVLVGIEMMPALPEVDISDEALEADDLARMAAAESWQDSYAADIEGLVLRPPVDWPAAGAMLAWDSIAIPMDEARRRRGLPEGRPDTVRCGPSDDGRQLVASAIYGTTAVGPFSVSSDLVWLDADAFFECAEAGAAALEEHEDEGPVIAPLLAAG